MRSLRFTRRKIQQTHKMYDSLENDLPTRPPGYSAVNMPADIYFAWLYVLNFLLAASGNSGQLLAVGETGRRRALRGHFKEEKRTSGATRTTKVSQFRSGKTAWQRDFLPARHFSFHPNHRRALRNFAP